MVSTDAEAQVREHCFLDMDLVREVVLLFACSLGDRSFPYRVEEEGAPSEAVFSNQPLGQA